MIHLSRPLTSHATVYQQIAAELEHELRNGYRCGDYLPPEQQLAERGWLQRRQGVGTLVLVRPYDYPLHSQARFSQNLLDQGSHPTSERLLAVLRPCTDHVATALSRQEGDTIIHLRTLRRVNGVPVCVIDHYLPDLDWWPSLQNFHSDSLHDFISDEIKQSLSRRTTRISARRALAKESKLLEIVPQAALLCVRTLNTCDGSNRVAEYSVSMTRADMIELTMEH